MNIRETKIYSGLYQNTHSYLLIKHLRACAGNFLELYFLLVTSLPVASKRHANIMVLYVIQTTLRGFVLSYAVQVVQFFSELNKQERRKNIWNNQDLRRNAKSLQSRNPTLIWLLNRFIRKTIKPKLTLSNRCPRDTQRGRLVTEPLGWWIR